MKILAIVVLAIGLAQILPSCGSGGDTEIIGWVEAKRFAQLDHLFYITINNHEYVVPDAFWRTVELGDLVKYDGTVWTILQKARGTPTPTPTPRPTTTPTPPPSPSPSPSPRPSPSPSR